MTDSEAIPTPGEIQKVVTEANLQLSQERKYSDEARKRELKATRVMEVEVHRRLRLELREEEQRIARECHEKEAAADDEYNLRVMEHEAKMDAARDAIEADHERRCEQALLAARDAVKEAEEPLRLQELKDLLHAADAAGVEKTTKVKPTKKGTKE